jgi:hypothetical protein
MSSVAVNPEVLKLRVGRGLRVGDFGLVGVYASGILDFHSLTVFFDSKKMFVGAHTPLPRPSVCMQPAAPRYQVPSTRAFNKGLITQLDLHGTFSEASALFHAAFHPPACCHCWRREHRSWSRHPFTKARARRIHIRQIIPPLSYLIHACSSPLTIHFSEKFAVAQPLGSGLLLQPTGSSAP